MAAANKQKSCFFYYFIFQFARETFIREKEHIYSCNFLLPGFSSLCLAWNSFKRMFLRHTELTCTIHIEQEELLTLAAQKFPECVCLEFTRPRCRICLCTFFVSFYIFPRENKLKKFYCICLVLLNVSICVSIGVAINVSLCTKKHYYLLVLWVSNKLSCLTHLLGGFFCWFYNFLFFALYQLKSCGEGVLCKFVFRTRPFSNLLAIFDATQRDFFVSHAPFQSFSHTCKTTPLFSY